MTEDDALAEAYTAGLVAERAGDRETAASHYRQCLALDAEDRCGASVRLASMGLAPAPKRAPDAYVATLFDQHAEAFDDILTGELGYAVPMQLGEWMQANRPGPYERLLDLGCGTGLAGMMLASLCDHATGVDLSENMIDMADRRACYDELFINEAVHFLNEWSRRAEPSHLPFDLIVATDTLPYIGALEPFFDGLNANATGSARIAFSAETLPPKAFSKQGWSITPHQRFAHDRDYLIAMCARADFDQIELFADITVRTEQGHPIPGYLVVASR